MNYEVLGPESAKALGKTADFGSKGVDAASAFGRYMAKFTGEPLEQMMGLFADKFRYRRLENLINFLERSAQKMEKLGIDPNQFNLPLKTAIPLLEAVSVEEEPELRELWENLMVNAMNPEFEGQVRPIFIHTLQHLTAFEAVLLRDIYLEVDRREKANIESTVAHQAKWDKRLKTPEDIQTVRDREMMWLDRRRKTAHSRSIVGFKPLVEKLGKSEELQIGLATLASLGCISIDYLEHEEHGEYMRYGFTTLGDQLIHACLLPE